MLAIPIFFTPFQAILPRLLITGPGVSVYERQVNPIKELHEITIG